MSDGAGDEPHAHPSTPEPLMSVSVTLSALSCPVERGALADARKLQLGTIPLCRLIYSEPNPGPLEHALGMAGRSTGLRRPDRRPRL